MGTQKSWRDIVSGSLHPSSAGFIPKQGFWAGGPPQESNHFPPPPVNLPYFHLLCKQYQSLQTLPKFSPGYQMNVTDLTEKTEKHASNGKMGSCSSEFPIVGLSVKTTKYISPAESFINTVLMIKITLKQSPATKNDFLICLTESIVQLRSRKTQKQKMNFH